MEVSNLSDAVMTDKVTDKEGTKHLLHRPSVKESWHKSCVHVETLCPVGKKTDNKRWSKINFARLSDLLFVYNSWDIPSSPIRLYKTWLAGGRCPNPTPGLAGVTEGPGTLQALSLLSTGLVLPSVLQARNSPGFMPFPALPWLPRGRWVFLPCAKGSVFFLLGFPDAFR